MIDGEDVSILLPPPTSNQSSTHAIDCTARAAEAIPCPMCGYDLRGLPEARCPECGTRYRDFAELTDPERRLHPFLFEHHPQRNLWSFARTLIAGNLPRRFWTQLRPAQPSRPRRLVLYWLICCGVLALPILGWAVQDGILLQRNNEMGRAWQKAFWSGGTSGVKPGVPPRSWTDLRDQFLARVDAHRRRLPVPSDKQAREIVKEFGSFDAYFDRTMPLAPSGSFFRIVFWQNAGRGILVLAMCVWPLTTALTMLIFQQTMRRAKIRPVHLLRVAIYCWDGAVWWGALTLVIVGWSMAVAIRSRTLIAPLSPTGRAGMLAFGLMLATILLLPLITWRLAVAIKRYLNFRHALATAISVQVITFLLMPVEMGVFTAVIRATFGI